MIKDIINLIRIRQWYKNIVIFLPLVFAKELFNFNAIFATILGFFSLCFISSSNYIINDIVDKKRDKNHPEKKNRPIASGKISILLGIILTLILFLLGFFLSLQLSIAFLGFSLLLFISTQIYSFWLKNEAFADILLISINFVIRTVSGAFVISDGFEPYMKISPWLVLCPFFLAFFLATSKRKVEVFYLEERAKSHRKVLGVYNKKLMLSMQILSTNLLIFCYALYTFFSPYPTLMVTIPFVIYLILRFFHLVNTNSIIATHPIYLYKDFRILFAGILTVMVGLVAIYGI